MEAKVTGNTGKRRRYQGVTSMTQGSPARLILFFALPLMFGNVFQQLYTVTDTAIVGRALGVEALAALGAVDWFNWLVLGVVQGITQGFSILIAQKFGSEDYEDMRKATGNSCMLAVICAVVLCVAAQSVIDPAIELLKAPKEIIPMASAYLRVMFCGIPVLMTYNMASAVLRALGDSKTPLHAMVLASLTNIGLDLLFVLVFGWGVEGAAVATILAQILSAVYCILAIRKIELLKLKHSDLKLETSLCRKLCVLAAPMAFQNGIIAVGGMIVQAVVNGFGVAFIAGFTATNKLYGVLEVAATSYGYAMVTYTGQNMGAGDGKRISRGVKAGLVIGMVTSLLITVVMLLFGRNILSCFISVEEAAGGEALEIAFRYLKIMSIFLPILYVLHIVRSSIQGMGNTVIPMVSGISEFVMRTGASFLLPVLFGENGILFAEVTAWIGADLILVPGYFHERRKIKT